MSVCLYGSLGKKKFRQFNMSDNRINRREFFKIAGIGLGGIAFNPGKRFPSLFADFTEEKLGRICVGMVEVKAEPAENSVTVKNLYEDAVLPWKQEIVGKIPNYVFNNQRWVETPDGYIYGPYIQPVYNRPNPLVSELPETSLGRGMWMEVTVPYVDARLDKEPSSNSWVKFKLEDGLPLRLYYSQVFWVDQLKTDSQGNTLYKVNPNFYGGVDMLWAAGEAFRPITNEELQPIHPEVIDKRIEVDVSNQTLSCFEGKDEVYFCRVSTGAKFDMYGNVVDKWETPTGDHKFTRKYISLQMSGGTTGAGYDLPGIGWSSIFATGGVAIHSTFWHNNYGDPVSHGCVNCNPEDAKWIFRWTLPSVQYDPGMVDVTVTGEDSTQVGVKEG